MFADVSSAGIVIITINLLSRMAVPFMTVVWVFIGSSTAVSIFTMSSSQRVENTALALLAGISGALIVVIAVDIRSCHTVSFVAMVWILRCASATISIVTRSA
jgi:hypothetical protein